MNKKPLTLLLSTVLFAGTALAQAPVQTAQPVAPAVVGRVTTEPRPAAAHQPGAKKKPHQQHAKASKKSTARKAHKGAAKKPVAQASHKVSAKAAVKPKARKAHAQVH